MSSFLVLCCFVLLCSYALSTIQNATILNDTHEIYVMTKSLFENPSISISCSKANCFIICNTENSCDEVIINANNINNLDISCNDYHSCNRMEINAFNETTLNLDCFYNYSCTETEINIIDSLSSLQCNKQYSCLDLNININTIPTTDMIQLSCNSLLSCTDISIYLSKHTYTYTEIDWLIFDEFKNDTMITIYCNSNNTILLYSSNDHDMICDNDICCPAGLMNDFYNSTDLYWFNLTDLEFESTQQELKLFTTTNVLQLDNYFLFEYFDDLIVPLFWFCALYTISVFIWSLTYFCANTLPSFHKSLKSKIKRKIGVICEESSRYSTIGYIMDILNCISDIVLTVFIIIFTDDQSYNINKELWRIAGYIAGIVSICGISLLLFKFKILSSFYAYIQIWRKRITLEYVPLDELQRQIADVDADNNINTISEQDRIKKWKNITNKNNKISLYFKYIIMYDLFSASLQDSLSCCVILYLLSDLNRDVNDDNFNGFNYYNHNISIETHVSTFNYFDWVLRIKLCIAFIFMFYKLFHAFGVYCNCHSDAIKNRKKLEPKYTDIDDIDYEQDIRIGLTKYQKLHDDTDQDNDVKDIDDNDSMRQRLIKFYQIHNPSKLDDSVELEAVLTRYKGRETELFDNLAAKYVKKQKPQRLNTQYLQVNSASASINQIEMQQFIATKPNGIHNDNGIQEEEDEQKDIQDDGNDDDDDDIIEDVFGDMNETKKYLGDPLGDEFEEKWSENTMQLVDDNQNELRNYAMKPVMIDVVNSLFIDIEHGNGGQQFINAMKILNEYNASKADGDDIHIIDDDEFEPIPNTFNNNDESKSDNKVQDDDDDDAKIDTLFNNTVTISSNDLSNNKTNPNHLDMNVDQMVFVNRVSGITDMTSITPITPTTIADGTNDDDDDDDQSELVMNQSLEMDDDVLNQIYQKNDTNTTTTTITTVYEEQSLDNDTSDNVPDVINDDNDDDDDDNLIPTPVIFGANLSRENKKDVNNLMDNVVTHTNDEPASQLLFGFDSEKDKFLMDDNDNDGYGQSTQTPVSTVIHQLQSDDIDQDNNQEFDIIIPPMQTDPNKEESDSYNSDNDNLSSDSEESLDVDDDNDFYDNVVTNKKFTNYNSASSNSDKNQLNQQQPQNKMRISVELYTPKDQQPALNNQNSFPYDHEQSTNSTVFVGSAVSDKHSASASDTYND